MSEITFSPETLAAINELTAKKKESELVEKGKRGELGVSKEVFETLLADGDLLGVAKTMGGFTAENATAVANIAYTNYESKKAKAEAAQLKAENEALKKAPPAAQVKIDPVNAPAGAGSQDRSSTIYPTFESLRQNKDRLDKLDPTYRLLIEKSY